MQKEKFKSSRLTTKKPVTIAVMPDAHVQPDQVLRRFGWFRNMEQDLRPDFTVCLGDFADMSSLCSYDKGKKEFEGRRYKKDVASVRTALEILGEPPEGTKRIMLLGNHCQRIIKACSSQPELDGILRLEDLGYEEHGWEVVPFKVPIEINGVTFCHYLPSGVMGYPITSAHAILNKTSTSAVVGHSHLLDYSERTDPYGQRKCALVAGCFFEHDEHYAGPANRMYRRGVAVLHDVHNGEFDFEWVGLGRLQRRYGS